eukprot:925385-Amphidinium_carterae.1
MTILREWQASMDIQPIHNANAAAKYILGYVLKSDTDKQTEHAFEQYIRTQQETGASPQDIYRTTYQYTKSRVTSPNEACFLMQGLPIVSFGDRGNVWIPTGLPDTWRTYLPKSLVSDLVDSAAVRIS